MRMSRFEVSGPLDILNNGINSLLIFFGIVLLEVGLFISGIFVFLEFSVMIGIFLCSLATIVFISGFFGYMTKHTADAIAAGFTMNDIAEGAERTKQQHLSLNETLEIGASYILAITVIVVFSGLLFAAGTVFSDVQAETYECQNGEIIKIESLEDGVNDCVRYTDPANGTSLFEYTGEDEALGVLEANATPTFLKWLGRSLIFASPFILLVGLVGLSSKFIADSVSIGLTLYTNQLTEEE